MLFASTSDSAAAERVSQLLSQLSLPASARPAEPVTGRQDIPKLLHQYCACPGRQNGQHYTQPMTALLYRMGFFKSSQGLKYFKTVLLAKQHLFNDLYISRALVSS